MTKAPTLSEILSQPSSRRVRLTFRQEALSKAGRGKLSLLCTDGKHLRDERVD